MIRTSRWVKTILIVVLLLLAATFVTKYVSALLDKGPEQPIPFSHRIHVTTKELNCFFCHPTPTISSNAGMPPVEKCLLCHNVIASNFAPIAKIRQYGDRKQGIPWVRVGIVPDFVFFSHQPHLARRFDCGRCHGNVAAMDRIQQVNDFTMGFCVDCHNANGGPNDCYTCHR